MSRDWRAGPPRAPRTCVADHDPATLESYPVGVTEGSPLPLRSVGGAQRRSRAGRKSSTAPCLTVGGRVSALSGVTYAQGIGESALANRAAVWVARIASVASSGGYLWFASLDQGRGLVAYGWG